MKDLSHKKVLNKIITELQDLDIAIGLIGYGSTASQNWHRRSDLDLCLVMQESPEFVESLHLFIDNIPIDLNLRGLKQIKENIDILKKGKTIGFEKSLIKGIVIWDKTGDLKKLILDNKEIINQNSREEIWVSETEHDKFNYRHALEKIRGLIGENNLAAKVMMDYVIYWLSHGYYALRGIEYPGDLPTLDHWKNNEINLYKCLEKYYKSTYLQEKYAILEEMTNIITSPIGGIQKNSEIIAFIRKNTKRTENNKNRFYEEKEFLINKLRIKSIQI